MIEMCNPIVVVGGGIAGMSAASALADLGHRVTLVEQGRDLGGHAARWACMATDECARCSACLVQDQIHRVSVHPRIETVLGAEITSMDGEAGAFHLHLVPRPGDNGGRPAHPASLLRDGRTVRAAAVLLATGFETYDPTEAPLLGYGRHEGVFTLEDLDHLLRGHDLAPFLPPGEASPRVAFIQCVGSRDRKAGREYCSQFCCRASIRLIRRLRHLAPSLEATVFYIDLQIMSKEFTAFFVEASDGVRFIQGVPAEVSLAPTEGLLRVYSILPGRDSTEAFDFDRVVLATGLTPNRSHQGLAEIFDLPLNGFGYFAPSESALPVETCRPGIFLAGACAGPTDIQGSRKQALAAASRAAAFMEDPRFRFRPLPRISRRDDIMHEETRSVDHG